MIYRPTASWEDDSWSHAWFCYSHGWCSNSTLPHWCQHLLFHTLKPIFDLALLFIVKVVAPGFLNGSISRNLEMMLELAKPFWFNRSINHAFELSFQCLCTSSSSLKSLFFLIGILKSLVRFWSYYKSMQNHVMLLDSSATKNIFWRVSRTFGASSGSFDALTKLSGPPSSTRGSIPFFIPRLHPTSKRKREEEAIHWGLNRNNITPRCDAFEILHVVPRRFLHYESPWSSLPVFL